MFKARIELIGSFGDIQKVSALLKQLAQDQSVSG